jgi:hypothetical protein
MIGEKFGRLTVLKVDRIVRCGKYVLCKCECGKTKTVFLGSLKQGKTKSCGCLNSELSSARRKTHGLTKTRTHNIWVNMKARCGNPNNPAYELYGARGIKVCKSWDDSFESFLNDMGKCPERMSIERINNDKGYNKDNCKWASHKEQSNNRRSNIHISYLGKSQTAMQWSKELNIPYDRLLYQLKANDFDLNKIINKEENAA